MSADIQGRPYAKLSEVKVGDKIELDKGFTCHEAGIVEVEHRPTGLGFPCKEGFHYIDGQAQEGYYMGIYKL